MHTQRRRTGSLTMVVVLLLLAVTTACLPVDVRRLAADQMDGRQAGTAGGARALAFLVGELRSVAPGAQPGRAGEEAYLQPFPGGTNVVAVIPGTDLAHEYVLVGAHYDHLGSGCRTEDPADRTCNGATDNATGSAVVLSVARALAARPARRSIVVALWDAEERGLVGSRYFAEHPLVPLDQVVATVNLDIQGANLLPSLRTTTFAVGTETGGPELAGLVATAAGGGSLATGLVSEIFGQGRSDHATFIAAGIPSVFLSDSTGPCYHSAQDSVAVVDFAKLDQQARTAKRLVRSLAVTTTTPAFVADRPVATFEDASAIRAVVERSAVDAPRFAAADQARLAAFRVELDRMVGEGRAAFDAADVSSLLLGTLAMSEILGHVPCRGYLAGT